MTGPIGDAHFVSIPVTEFEELCARAANAEENVSVEDEDPIMIAVIVTIIVTFIVVLMSIVFGYFLGITRNRNE